MSDVSTLKDFQKKYYDQISGIAKQQGTNIGTATDMFVANAMGRGNYSGGGTFDMNQPVQDYQSLRMSLLQEPETKPVQRTSKPVDYTAQATQQVSPAFQKIQNQLAKQVESTRRALPQALGARGQAVGGLRLGQEDVLTRDLAYGTADIAAQEQSAIQEQAARLSQAEQQRLAQERQFGFQERGISLQEQGFAEQQRQNEFSRQLALQGLATDQERFEYQQARDVIGDAFAQQQFDESVRQFGLRNAIDQANLRLAQQQEARLSRPQAQQVDISQFTPTLDYLYRQDPQSALNFINQSIATPEQKIALMQRYGVTPSMQTTQPTGTVGIERFQPQTELTGTGIIAPPSEPQEQQTREISPTEYNRLVSELDQFATGIDNIFVKNDYNLEDALSNILNTTQALNILPQTAQSLINEMEVKYKQATGQDVTSEVYQSLSSDIRDKIGELIAKKYGDMDLSPEQQEQFMDELMYYGVR